MSIAQIDEYLSKELVKFGYEGEADFEMLGNDCNINFVQLNNRLIEENYATFGPRGRRLCEYLKQKYGFKSVSMKRMDNFTVVTSYNITITLI